MYIDYIYLEDSERRWFAQNNHEYLIEQLQINSKTLYSRGKKDDPIESKPCDLNNSNDTPTVNNNTLDYGANCIGTVIKDIKVETTIMLAISSTIFLGEYIEPTK